MVIQGGTKMLLRLHVAIRCKSTQSNGSQLVVWDPEVAVGRFAGRFYTINDLYLEKKKKNHFQ